MSGAVEEPGWRGVGLDGADRGLGFMCGALMLGALWSLWHLPLYFIDGTFPHGLGVGTPDFWASMLGRVPLAVLLAWLVVGTRGMVVAAVVAHAMGNTIGEVLETGSVATFAELTVTGLAATALLVAWARAGDERSREPAGTPSDEHLTSTGAHDGIRLLPGRGRQAPRRPTHEQHPWGSNR